MSTVPEATRLHANSVRVASEPMRLVLPDGTAVAVLTSYAVRPGAALYSLAAPIEFHCVQCHEPCEATLVAIRVQWLVCPSCYAALDPADEPVAESTAEPPQGQQPTAA